MSINLTPYFSVLRQAASMTGGMLIAFNIKGADPTAITGGVDHIINGASEIAIGIGMLLPTGAAIWGAISGTKKQQALSVTSDGAAVLQVKPGTTGPLAQLAADPTVPNVVQARTA